MATGTFGQPEMAVGATQTQAFMSKLWWAKFTAAVVFVSVLIGALADSLTSRDLLKKDPLFSDFASNPPTSSAGQHHPSGNQPEMPLAQPAPNPAVQTVSSQGSVASSSTRTTPEVGADWTSDRASPTTPSPAMSAPMPSWGPVGDEPTEPAPEAEPLPMPLGPQPIDISKPALLASSSATVASGKACSPRIYDAKDATGLVTDALTRAGNINCVQAPLTGEMMLDVELCGGERTTIQAIRVERRAHDETRSRNGVGRFFYSIVDNGVASLPQPMRGGPGGLHTVTFPATYASYIRILVRTPPLKSYNTRIYQQVCSITVS